MKSKIRMLLATRKDFLRLIGAFFLLLIFAVVLSSFFFVKEAVNYEETRRLYIESNVIKSAERMSSGFSTYQRGTSILKEAPALQTPFSPSDSADSAPFSDEMRVFLQTYIQSRFAFVQIAYYMPASGAYIGFADKIFEGNGREALRAHLHLTEEALESVLAEDGFVFTQDPKTNGLVLANHLEEGCIVFRTIPWKGISSQFANPYTVLYQDINLLPKWQISIFDRIGQSAFWGDQSAADDTVIIEDLSALSGMDNTNKIKKSNVSYRVSVIPIENLHMTVCFADQDQRIAIIFGIISRSLLVYTITLLLFGTICILFLATVIHKPVENILNKLPSENRLAQSTHEYEQIDSAISALTQKKRMQESTILSQNERMRSFFLRSLAIHNAVVPNQLDSLLCSYRLTHLFRHYRILMILLPDSQQEIKSCSDLFSRLNSLSIPDVVFSMIRATDSLIVMASADSDVSLDNLCETIYNRFRTGGNPTDVYVYSSGLHRNAIEAHSAYNEALRTAQYNLAAAVPFPAAQYIEGLFLSDHTFAPKLMTFSQQAQIMSFLQKEDYEQAGAAFSEFVLRISRNTQPYDYKVAQLANVIINTLCMVNSRTSQRSISPEHLTQLDELMNNPYSAQEFYEKAVDLFTVLLPHQTASGHSARLNSIIQYLQLHFRDNNLSASSVSETFNMSVSSFSREFQRGMQMTFTDYLHSLRLQSAKSLLKNTKKPLRQIAEEVGYSNELTMTRAFKKYEGITPGEFRNQMEGG